MSNKTSVERFSTIARFELLADGRSFKVAQVASDFLELEVPTDIAPGPAVLVIRVDESEEIRRDISLPQGASARSPQVQISRPQR